MKRKIRFQPWKHKSSLLGVGVGSLHQQSTRAVCVYHAGLEARKT